MHAHFRALVGVASEPQLAALVTCDSAVVRGYVAAHVIASVPSLVPDTYPLLADATEVETLDGCSGARVRLGLHVLGALAANAAQPGPQSLLVRAVSDAQLPSDIRAAALPRAGDLHAAVSWLESPDPVLVEAAVRALGTRRDPRVFARLPALASHPAPGVRAAVATALGSHAPASSRAVLESLAGDPDEYVRSCVASGYLTLGDADPARVHAFLRDPSHRVRSTIADGLARRRTPGDLALLRGSLRSDDRNERLAAAGAFAIARDAEAIPLLEHLLAEEDPTVVTAAAGALYDLGAARSWRKVEAAADRMQDAGIRMSLRGIAHELRATARR